MPSLLLQPLVENSIKHAVSRAIKGGSISIAAAVSGQKLRLSVADNGPGLDLHPGGKPPANGVGLVNCRERLKEIYGDEQSFGYGTNHPHGLVITIVIPLERQEDRS